MYNIDARPKIDTEKTWYNSIMRMNLFKMNLSIVGQPFLNCPTRNVNVKEVFHSCSIPGHLAEKTKLPLKD